MNHPTKSQHPDDAGTEPPFVFGFGFKNGTAAEIRWEDAIAQKMEYDFIWLHLNAKVEETGRWLRSQGEIPAAAVRALLASETRPRVTSFENGHVVNLRGVNLNEGAEPEDMVSIRIWIDAKRVISARLRVVKAAQDIRAELTKGLTLNSPGAVVARLAARLTDRVEPYVEDLVDQVDAIEDDVLKGESEGCRGRLADARQSAVHFRRYIAPQRDALTRLTAEENDLFDKNTRIELRETADRVTRMTEEIDAARERAMVLQDQLADRRAEDMNRNMMILSVVAAIFLPLGFLTGLFGINVGGMPGADSPTAFWVVVLACVLIGAALLALFKLVKWL